MLRPAWVGAFAAALAALLAAVVLSSLPSASSVRAEALRAEDTESDGGNGGDTTRAGRRVGATRVEAARSVLKRLAEAVEQRDKQAYMRAIDPRQQSGDFGRVAERTYDNLRRMGVRSVAFDEPRLDQGGLTPRRAEELGGDAFVAETTLRFRLEGPDRRNEWSTTMRMTFVRRGGQTYVANDREGVSSAEAMPLWLSDQVRAVQGEKSTVVGAVGKETLREYSDLADRAVPRVTEVWGDDWAGHLVLVVPRTQSQMERAIGAENDSQGSVAAVTTSVGRAEPASASHIVVNPATFGDIGELGRLIVLTHEITHVATNATVSQMPMWLSEGFADYVGFRDTGLETDRIAKELLASVRKNGTPERLPDREEFDPRSGQLDEAYESAWSACDYVASRWDEQTLVRLYREVDQAGTEEAANKAFARVLGVELTEFTRDWRDYVSSLAATA